MLVRRVVDISSFLKIPGKISVFCTPQTKNELPSMHYNF